jgi:metallo-beta-lactamase family protein
MGQDQQFTRDDVHDLLNRVKAIQYESGFARQYIDVDENDEDLQFQFGDAGHLLGSAWLALESGGRRVVFSGDLGGRSAHLCDIENPPSADTLLLESTYGDRNTHASLDDARRELFEEIVDAVERGIPVLIPTFAVGRAQEILQTIRQYWQQLPEEQRDEFTVVYDGMAQDATDTYHAFATDGYINDSVLNYKMNAGDNEPFLPECAHRPTDPDERPLLLEGTDSPVIVSPSGMLTGGLSPVYLLDLVRNYDAAKVLFVGYQAEGTPGRKLQDATGEMCRVHLPTRDWDEPEYNDGHTVSIPTDWVRTIDGMSGHAAANTLMQFAREVDPTHISLIHGEANRQRQFKDFLETNTTADVVSLTGIQTPFAVGEADESIHLQAGMDRVGDVEPTGDDPVRDESTESVDDVVDQDAAVEDQVDALQAYVRHLEREIASLRNDNGWTEAEIREVVRDEMK